MVFLFNGTVRPYSALPVFWRYWMYYVNPVTWWLRGVLSTVLPSVVVQCAPDEMTYFNPPPGQTCGAYADAFVTDIAGSGYLTNPNATANCGYCAYANGREYMHMLNVGDADKWRCFGIFLAFVIINWLLVYFFIYTVRIRGWTFGMSTIFGLLGKGLDVVKQTISRVFGGKRTSNSGDAVVDEESA
jgi:ATP-binding cassette, subfamily G (WHITE), member 2, SNQ2